ncbi:hypothetical protein ACXR0O_21000 [Verrucomicrobiota bacterium sgz303538]
MSYEEIIATAIPQYIESTNPEDLCEAIIWPTKILLRIFMNGRLAAEATITLSEYKDLRQRYPQLFHS